MKIGILQAGRAPQTLQSEHGDYDRMSQNFLGLSDKNVRHYAVLDGEFPDNAHECDAWFITGSRHGVYEDHDWIPPLEAFIRYAKAEKRKMVGVCFGHQIMAQALGGRVVKHNSGFAVGATDYEILGEDASNSLATLYAYHQDQVIRPPKDAKLIMTADYCQYAGLSYDDWGLSVQPHPEFLTSYVSDLIKARKGTTLSHRLADLGLSSLSKATTNNVKIKIRTFLGLSPI